MNDFKGLARDMSTVKTPEQMWQYARNILLTSKYTSVTNEKGNEYGYSLPGVVIGFVISNEDIVYLSKDGDYTCVGYVNYITQTYISVIRTTNPKFQFNLNSPLEGVYIYNYKKELIVVFSDGINKNSSSPKLINLHNPQVALSAAKEFIQADDYLMFELFSYVDIPASSFKYERGSLDAEVVHMTFCYVFDDNTDSLYSPIIETVYPNFKGDNTVKRNVTFDITNLSSKFKKIRLAFVVKKAGGLFGYTTPILSIVNNKVSYTLSSEEDLTIATPEEIVIAPERYSKIRTLTKTANQIVISNLEKDKEVSIQKYVNQLVLALKPINNDEYEKYKTHPTFLPDEVYAISIIPLYTNSSKGDAYHIPGRKGTSTERATLSDGEINALGLNFPKYKGKGYKDFHFTNRGQSSVGSTTFGYWENENTYPAKDEYNSTSVGGEDLRNTPIRYHRIPAIDTITTSYKPKVNDDYEPTLGMMPRFKIEVTNFNDIIPLSIREKLQGYEIVIEKRNKGGTYIETNGFLYKYTLPEGVDVLYKVDEQNGTLRTKARPEDFTVCGFVSPEVAIDRIGINADIVKVYVPVTKEKPILDKNLMYDNKLAFSADVAVNTPTLFTPFEKIASIKEAKYLLANNISSENRFGEERLQLTLEHLRAGDLSNDFVPVVRGTGSYDLNVLFSSLVTLNKNIYNLENNNDFISVGVVIFDKANEPLVNGDVFTTSVIKKGFSAKSTDVTVTGKEINVHNFVNYYLYNSYSPISNAYIVNGAGVTKSGRKIGSGSFGFGQISSLFGIYRFYRSWDTEDVNILNSFDYSTVVKSSGVIKSFNDYTAAVPPALNNNFINYFPYRVHKGLAIPNESLQTKNLRFFPTNSYYDMRNDRGEVIAIRGYNRGVYIQQRYSLFQTSIADKLNASAEETYLGSSEIFDRIPEEIMYNDNIGYVGSNSQFACIVTKDGYATVDEERGKVFIVGEGMEEISQQYLKNYFQKALPLGDKYMKKDLLNKDVKVDNPYVSIGYLLGIDEANNRLILTKKYYAPKPTTNGLSFDGEFFKDTLGNILDFNDAYYFKNESLTYSYALDSKTWVAPHDYHPNAYLHNSRGFYGIENKKGTAAKLYKFNSNNVNPGNYFGKQYESYVDLIHNTRLDINKQYQAIYWVTEAVDMTTERILQFDTIDKVMLYSNHQCSGIIPVSKTSLGNARNVEGIWQLNEFRDMMKSAAYKIIDEDGKLITDGLLTQKQWFTKGLFIGNFIVTRFIWTNQTKVLKHIHNVNVKSITSNR